MDREPTDERLFRALAGALPPAERQWLEKAMPVSERDPGGVPAAYAGAARRARRIPPEALEAARSVLADQEGAWSGDALLRATLLLGACQRLAPAMQVELVRDLIQRGDNAERTAVLKSLALLPSAERFIDIAVEACRSNVQDVFEAIACENVFPARYFSQEAFNNMVLKAAFLGIALARVVGLGSRLNDELKRMAHAYASERRAAGRSVPDDLGLLLEATDE